MIRRPPRSTLFPTRRSSDLFAGTQAQWDRITIPMLTAGNWSGMGLHLRGNSEDRKSTRLNSSHVEISYAVFCLKKKKLKNTRSPHALHNHTHPRLNSSIRPT